jgi:hypothetical protein
MIQQAAEMLFRNPQPTSMNEAIQHLSSDFPREEEGIKDLELASNELERAMRQVNRLNQKRWKQLVVVGDSLEDYGPSEQFGPKARVLTTHQPSLSALGLALMLHLSRSPKHPW